MIDAQHFAATLRAISRQLAGLADGLTENEPERTPEESLTLIADGKCLYCTEPLTDPQIRGLHQHCYQTVRRRLTERGLSLKDAEKRGMLAARKPGGRQRRQGRLEEFLSDPPDPASVSLATAAALLKTVDEEGNPKKPRRKKKGGGK